MSNCVTCRKQLVIYEKHVYRVVPKVRTEFIPKLELQKHNNYLCPK